MKKLISLVLAIMLACSAVGGAFAEQDQGLGGLFNALGSFFSDAYNEVSGWVEGAWEDTSKWIEGAWGDASKWIEQALGDSSAWFNDIWGDASTWVNDAAGTVNTWWKDTFATVTEDSKNAWSWMQEKAEDLKTQGAEVLDKAKVAVADFGTDAEDKVKEVFNALLEKLGLNEKNSSKVMDSMKAYSEQKGIDLVTTLKIAIPYTMKLCADSTANPGGSIPAVAVAQYLIAAIEKLAITDVVTAEKLVLDLNEILSAL